MMTETLNEGRFVLLYIRIYHKSLLRKYSSYGRGNDLQHRISQIRTLNITKSYSISLWEGIGNRINTVGEKMTCYLGKISSLEPHLIQYSKKGYMLMANMKPS